MILIIDNYDSFTYNLYQLIGTFEKSILVKRNDEISIEEIKKLKPRKIIISPGPGNPNLKKDFGICLQIIEEFKDELPILGICLGHQGIFAAFGGKIVSADPKHGKSSEIYHNGDGIFKGIQKSFAAIRYHSLVCEKNSTPNCIQVIAETQDEMIMGIKHREFPVYGLQFHPESIGTVEGENIIKNFLEIEI
jgi:anthranilate synthase component II